MKNYNAILTEKQQKVSALSAGKIDKYNILQAKIYYLLIKVV